MTDRQTRLELAEGDLLQRRRKCERLLGEAHDDVENYDEGDEVPYASLSIYVGDDYLQVRDVDGVSAALIKESDLPDTNPERIEALQERLDELHEETLAEL